MGVTNSTTVLRHADHELGSARCSALLGREAERRPMEARAEWRPTSTSSVMVDADAGAPDEEG